MVDQDCYGKSCDLWPLGRENLLGESSNTKGVVNNFWVAHGFGNDTAIIQKQWRHVDCLLKYPTCSVLYVAELCIKYSESSRLLWLHDAAQLVTEEQPAIFSSTWLCWLSHLDCCAGQERCQSNQICLPSWQLLGRLWMSLRRNSVS